MTTTVVDAVGAARDWVNSRTLRLVGQGNPLQKGAFLKDHDGSPEVCYAVLRLMPGTTIVGGAESGTMAARIEAQIFGPTLGAVTDASVAFADEIVTYLGGRGEDVGGVRLWVADDVTGPYDLPDGNLPRHIVDFTLLAQPV